MYTTTTHTLDDLFVFYCNLYDVIQLNASIFHRISLRNSTWEAIKQEACFTVVLSDTLFYQRNDQIIRNQTTSFHNLFHFQTQLSALFHCSTQHVAR